MPDETVRIQLLVKELGPADNILWQCFSRTIIHNQQVRHIWSILVIFAQLLRKPGLNGYIYIGPGAIAMLITEGTSFHS